MKIWTFLLVPLFILGAVSCNMEKRLYRNGWYIEKNKPHTFTANPESNPVSGASTFETYDKSVSTPDAVGIDSIVTTTTVADPVIKTQVPDSSLPKKDVTTMSHRELIKSMKEKGCAKPNQSANLVYWLAVASICICILPPFSILLALMVLVMCKPAEQKVMAAGECPRENLALINKARKMAWWLIALTLVTILTLIILLITLSFAVL